MAADSHEDELSKTDQRGSHNTFMIEDERSLTTSCPVYQRKKQLMCTVCVSGRRRCLYIFEGTVCGWALRPMHREFQEVPYSAGRDYVLEWLGGAEPSAEQTEKIATNKQTFVEQDCQKFRYKFWSKHNLDSLGQWLFWHTKSHD